MLGSVVRYKAILNVLLYCRKQIFRSKGNTGGGFLGESSPLSLRGPRVA